MKSIKLSLSFLKIRRFTAFRTTNFSKNFENQLDTFSKTIITNVHYYIDIHGWATQRKNVDVVEIIKGKVKKGEMEVGS
jgi:hypothetical protein